MIFTPVEKQIIIDALNEQIESDRKIAKKNPGTAGYAARNIERREELIKKVESL
jgi:hypothetical protein